MSNEIPTPSPAPLRISNLFAKTSEPLEKSHFVVPQSIYNYFFRLIFPGRRGIHQELGSYFFSALYVECQKRGLVGERACWDPSNERIVAEILRDLNFSPREPAVPDSGGRPRKRRAAPRADVPPRQPEPGARD